MNWFSFEYPLAVLLLLPLIYCLYRCKEKLHVNYFVHLHLFSPSKGWLKLEWIIKILVLISLTVALCSPIVVDKLSSHNKQGRDIVLALDGSGSMNASGFHKSSRQSRFEIVKELAQEFILKRDDDNIGVVYYGDFAFIASPITYEKSIVSDMIGYLNYAMAGQNTSIGEGVAMSVRAFSKSKAASKIIILLSDGEHNSGRISPKDAVFLAQGAGIKIYTIAISDKNVDAALLQQIAAQSGGSYFFASDADELKNIYSEIDLLERSKIKSSEYLKKEYYYHYPLLAAFFLLLYLLYKKQIV
ncbi:MAG: VWA domain-containing protein [Campylobacterota bacterium]|nr:VWA domain-containing protein [Campylobacterota bacterium]